MEREVLSAEAEDSGLKSGGLGRVYMIAYAGGPEPDHAVERNQHGEEVREEEHGLGADAEVALDVPEAEG